MPADGDPVGAVLRLLQREGQNFWTLQGFSERTGLPAIEVKKILESQPEQVRESAVLGPNGRRLFTSRAQGVTWLERLAKLSMYMTRILLLQDERARGERREHLGSPLTHAR
jgi:hypothetical protein